MLTTIVVIVAVAQPVAAFRIVAGGVLANPVLGQATGGSAGTVGQDLSGTDDCFGTVLFTFGRNQIWWWTQKRGVKFEMVNGKVVVVVVELAATGTLGLKMVPLAMRIRGAPARGHVRVFVF